MKSLFSFTLALSLGLTAISVQATAQEQKQPTKQQDSGSPVFQILEKVLTPVGQAETQPTEPEIPLYPGARCNINHVNMTMKSIIVSCKNENIQGVKIYAFRTDGTDPKLSTDYVWDMIQTAMKDDRLDFQVRYNRDEIPPATYCGLNAQDTQKYCREPRRVGLVPSRN